MEILRDADRGMPPVSARFLLRFGADVRRRKDEAKLQGDGPPYLCRGRAGHGHRWGNPGTGTGTGCARQPGRGVRRHAQSAAAPTHMPPGNA